MIDPSDPAYPYALAATEKEARNAEKRAKHKQPSPLLNVGVMAVLFAVALTHWQDGAHGFALLFCGLASFNGYTAYRSWRQTGSGGGAS